MGWRFRKSFSPLPGVRITLSPSGLSTSVGVGPIRVTSGPRGQHVTATIPGTGLSFQQRLQAPQQPAAAAVATPTLPGLPPPVAADDIRAIRSGGSAGLTTSGLAEFKRLLQEAGREHAEIVRELAAWRNNEQIAVRKVERWRRGWLLRRVRKSRYASLEAAASEASERRAELEQQESLARLQTSIDLPKGVHAAYLQFLDTFTQLSRVGCIWDTVGARATNMAVERTSAGRSVARQLVRFELGKCELLETDWTVPRLGNANGGELFLYPAFAIYFINLDSFALLDTRRLR